jgi:S1-C subfamily serine protease
MRRHVAPPKRTTLARKTSLLAIIAASIIICARPAGAQALAQSQTIPGLDPGTPARDQSALSRNGALLSQFSESLDALSSRVSLAVVQVQVTGYGAVEGSKEHGEAALIARERALGSGVIVDPDGYIITNAHVVKGAHRVRVLLTAPASGGSQVQATLGLADRIPPVDAKIVGVSDSLDIALQIERGSKLMYITFEMD